MNNIYTKTILLSTCALSLIASGGVPGGTGSGSNAAYEYFKSTASKTSTLSGVALQANNKDDSTKLIAVTGSLQHKTGAITVQVDTYKFVDADGPDENNTLYNGDSTLTYKANFPDTYKYVTTYEQSYALVANTFNVSGIIGVATVVADMPKAATVTYTGDAEAFVATSTSGFDMIQGKSQLVANFATSKISATLNGFTAVNQATGKTVAAPFDELKITDMAIKDNLFSGGTIATFKAANEVKLLGASPSNTSNGGFYGLKSDDSAPAEIGGQLLMQSENGIINATYLAK